MTIDDVAVWLASRPFGPLHRSATGAWTQTTVVGLWTVTCTADEYRVPDSASVAGKSGGPRRIDLRALEAAVDGHRRAAGTPGSWRSDWARAVLLAVVAQTYKPVASITYGLTGGITLPQVIDGLERAGHEEEVIEHIQSGSPVFRLFSIAHGRGQITDDQLWRAEDFYSEVWTGPSLRSAVRGDAMS